MSNDLLLNEAVFNSDNGTAFIETDYMDSISTNSVTEVGINCMLTGLECDPI